MQLSIIIPTLNEAQAIEPCLRKVAAHAPEAERIVVDGGSQDGTPLAAQGWARVLSSPRGRGIQMNRGAREARGRWLLFLHADTLLPDGFWAELERAQGLGYRAGAFRLRIAGRHPLLPVLALGANLRTRLTGIALGDQALFAERAWFLARGGFPDLPLMEDYAWSRALRAHGERLCLARLAVTTSGRRWDSQGFWRTWWQMRGMTWRFRHGSAAQALAEGYPPLR